APEESFSTVEVKINFFRPVWQALLKAEGTVVRRGPHDRVRGVLHNRRGEPIGCESSFHVHGASWPEGHRTVILLRFVACILEAANTSIVYSPPSFAPANQIYLAFVATDRSHPSSDRT